MTKEKTPHILPMSAQELAIVNSQVPYSLEQYAFEGFPSNMTRADIEHYYHKKKPKPTYSKEYNPNKSKIDFQGPTYNNIETRHNQ